MASMFDALHISSTGLTAQRLRLKLISSNIANVNTTRTPQGGPYRRKEAIFAAMPSHQSFEDELRNHKEDPGARDVRVVGVVEDPRAGRMKYDPGHPDANEEGYVEMPNVSIVEEMANLMVARRSFEANVAAINATKQLMMRSLEIGK